MAVQQGRGVRFQPRLRKEPGLPVGYRVDKARLQSENETDSFRLLSSIHACESAELTSLLRL